MKIEILFKKIRKYITPGALAGFFSLIILVILILLPGFFGSTLNLGLPDDVTFKKQYPALMLAAAFLWIVLMLIFLVYLLWRYDIRRFPKNPYKNESLGLPPGTIRGILTMTLLVMVVLAEIFVLVSGKDEKSIEYLHTGFQMMLAFYFGTRIVGTLSEKPREGLEHSIIDEAAQVPESATEDPGKP
ncbi:MAG: hypothetical protein CV087_08150 [Candidatus Brocadia sp. WS118]|nr:MAG: hypothetical protein CV087_08150 [Candidatus Brocadia sp. WS118]